MPKPNTTQPYTFEEVRDTVRWSMEEHQCDEVVIASALAALSDETIMMLERAKPEYKKEMMFSVLQYRKAKNREQSD